MKGDSEGNMQVQRNFAKLGDVAISAAIVSVFLVLVNPSIGSLLMVISSVALTASVYIVKDKRYFMASLLSFRFNKQAAGKDKDVFVLAIFWGVYIYLLFGPISTWLTQILGGILGSAFATVLPIVVDIVAVIPGVWASKKYLHKYQAGQMH